MSTDPNQNDSTSPQDQQSPKTTTPQKRPTMAEITAQRRARYMMETGNITPEQSEKAALDYLERESIKKQQAEEKRKFQVNTDISLARLDIKTKADQKAHNKKVNKNVDEDQLRRQREAILREEQLKNIRARKQEALELENQKKLERLRLIEEGTYIRQHQTTPQPKGPQGGVGTVSGAPLPDGYGKKPLPKNESDGSDESE